MDFYVINKNIKKTVPTHPQTEANGTKKLVSSNKFIVKPIICVVHNTCLPNYLSPLLWLCAGKKTYMDDLLLFENLIPPPSKCVAFMRYVAIIGF